MKEKEVYRFDCQHCKGKGHFVVTNMDIEKRKAIEYSAWKQFIVVVLMFIILIVYGYVTLQLRSIYPISIGMLSIVISIIIDGVRLGLLEKGVEDKYDLDEDKVVRIDDRKGECDEKGV